MMSTRSTTFPVQKLPESKKNKKWMEACVDNLVGRPQGAFSGGRSMYSSMQANYDLYNGIYNENDLKYVTNPFNVKDGFPAAPKDINIVRSRINLLVGEESKRPFNIFVTQANDNVTSIASDKAKDLLMEYVTNYAVGQNGQQTDEEGNPLTPSQIQKYLTYEYKDIAEQCANHTLRYLTLKENVQHEFLKGWLDALIAAREIYYVGAINNNPTLERVNPLHFAYDMSPDLEFIEDGDWCRRKMRMTASELYDRYFDKINPTDLDKLLNDSEDSMNDGAFSSTPPVRFTNIDTVPGFSNDTDNGSSGYSRYIDVHHVCWKSFRKVGFLTYMDEMGNPQEMLVDESYVPQENESIEWDWVIVVWEGYKALDIYFGIGPIANQTISVDNPNYAKLPYTGVVYSNANSTAKSLIDVMKPLQYMYIILWYRLELALARDKGKAVIMDITQIPKSMDISPEKWLHYLSALGVMFVNPYEEGFDIAGREGGRAAAFNQFSSIDLSMANVIAGYIQLMDKIEQLIGELSGVSSQRQGAIHHSELVGNVERSVVQSSHITESLFWLHNQAKKRAMSMLLDTAKSMWANSNKKHLHYVTDDATRIFMDITDDFLYADFDIFVTDSTREAQDIEALKSLLQPAMQNGASLFDAASVITSKSMSEIKNKLKEVDARNAEMQQQMQQQQSQMAMQAEEARAQFEQSKLEMEKYKVDTDSATKLSIAQMSIDQQNVDANRNGIPDILELRKQDDASRRSAEEMDIKREELRLKQANATSDRQVTLATLKANLDIAKANLAQLNIKGRTAEVEGAAKIDALQSQSEIKDKELRIKILEATIKKEELKKAKIETASKLTELNKADSEAQLKEVQAVAAVAKLGIEERKLDIEEDKISNELEIKRQQLALNAKKLYSQASSN